jgi:hypothetical protein
MSSIVYFNGNQYDPTKIRAQAGLGHDVEIKRAEIALHDADVRDGELARPEFKFVGGDTSDVQPDRLTVVYQHAGKYYVLCGAVRAIEAFGKSDTMKVRVITKHMLKKCLLGYEGAKIVVEAPEPRRYGSYRDDAQRSTYNRNTRDR